MNTFAPDHIGVEVRPSPNFGPRRDGLRPELIILHYTGMATGAAAEDWLCNPASEVSSHYLVHEDGRIVQMVRENDRAWHAGKSSWKGVTDINSWSIGIEIVNPGHEFGYVDFPSFQIEAVIELCRGIIGRHAIRPDMVLAHSDVAPGRKVDPGERFPWGRLAIEGVGHFVTPTQIQAGPSLVSGSAEEPVRDFQRMLSRYGYDIDITGTYDQRTATIVSAFQRHFRPARVDGVADVSTTKTLQDLCSLL
ncbi:N-acetylmuramoyl-L-alanine amidase [Pseudaminobacter sp. 19-2017]|uniref:N-acetylmuramoyl-L-alanine amidase n=1 Tax=Pseudaminobacter soli (ex Zhang et al. 2022) TaxID=2831468 RepID=A0A942DXC4_9HYPH|nr:N-acetylmuramoyl-L-alanine amidase [Pseudaminobacter soli]MBS3649171.1 N-acetylmuramoyl-L-alanine amidase [Pseudaminobacter soli]